MYKYIFIGSHWTNTWNDIGNFLLFLPDYFIILSKHTNIWVDQNPLCPLTNFSKLFPQILHCFNQVVINMLPSLVVISTSTPHCAKLFLATDSCSENPENLLWKISECFQGLVSEARPASGKTARNVCEDGIREFYSSNSFLKW